jgi:FdhD protein
MTTAHIPFSYLQYTPQDVQTIQSEIATEHSVSLTVNGEIWLAFQCTPADLEDLGIGFLFNEGFIRSMDEVANLHICDQKDNIDIWLNHAATKPLIWRRTSGCHGGNTSTALQRDQIQPITTPYTLTSTQIFALTQQFLDEQTPHHQSGGVHTSALADSNQILFYTEDIGRHNTFDKIAGHILRQAIPVTNPILLTSGRISSDMLQKTVRLRAPILISMRSASSIGIRLADEWGITLISNARRGRFNVYTHPERIQQQG